MANMDLEAALKFCKDEAEETRLRFLYERVNKCRQKINDAKKDKDKFQADIVNLQSRLLNRDKNEKTMRKRENFGAVEDAPKYNSHSATGIPNENHQSFILPEPVFFNLIP